MTNDDPTIQAVRDARRLISSKVGHDPRKLVEHYRQVQERHRSRLVSLNSPTLEEKEEDAA